MKSYMTNDPTPIRKNNLVEVSLPVTVVIPTFNRSELLSKSISSVVQQDYPAINIVVVDNHSTDSTSDVVMSFKDKRIRHIRNSRNLGLYRNLRQSLDYIDTEYGLLLQDDDLLLPGAITNAVNTMQLSNNIALVVGGAQGIDLDEEPTRLPEDSPPIGAISGIEYIYGICFGRNWVIHMSSVLMRMTDVRAIGGFDNRHSAFQFDLSMYLRIAAKRDLYFMDTRSASIRLHDGKNSNLRFNTPEATGPLVTLAERLDACALLLEHDLAENFEFRKTLSQQILKLNERHSAEVKNLIPDIDLATRDTIELIEDELAETIGKDNTFIFIDEDSWRFSLNATLKPIPFLSHDGIYHGVPESGKKAASEIQKQLKSGIRYVAITANAFCWTDYYGELRDALHGTCDLILSNSRLMIWNLKK